MSFLKNKGQESKTGLGLVPVGEERIQGKGVGG
jgi:hypothetical protein